MKCTWQPAFKPTCWELHTKVQITGGAMLLQMNGAPLREHFKLLVGLYKHRVELVKR